MTLASEVLRLLLLVLALGTCDYKTGRSDVAVAVEVSPTDSALNNPGNQTACPVEEDSSGYASENIIRNGDNYSSSCVEEEQLPAFCMGNLMFPLSWKKQKVKTQKRRSDGGGAEQDRAGVGGD